MQEDGSEEFLSLGGGNLRDKNQIPGDEKNWKWSKVYETWKFVDDEFLDSEVERISEGLEDIYRGVIEKLAEDRVYEPTLDEAKAILTHIALESAADTDDYAPRNACKPTVEFIDSQINFSLIQSTLPKNRDLYFENIETDPDEDINSKASNCRLELKKVNFFERMSLQTSDELALFIAQNLDKYESSVIQESSESGSYAFVHSLLHDIHMSGEAQNEVALLCLEHVSKIEQDSEKNERWGTYEYYTDEFTRWARERIFSPTELNKDVDDYKGALHLYISKNGLPRVLNMLRADLSDPEKKDKAEEMLLSLLGSSAHEGKTQQAVTDKNVNEFYDAVFLEPKEYELNTSESKEFRINMVSRVLREHGVPQGGSVAEFACGTGWLSGGLEAEGVQVHAFDRHPSMVEIGHNSYPNVVFARFNWNRWQEWNELKETLIPENSQDAVVINGRSDRHMQYPFETMGQVSSILKDGGIYMSDSPDVETKGTPQERQLSQNRDLHEMLDFYRPWLDKYFWHTVGGPKDQQGFKHLIESWVPSQELKILYAEANGLKHMETIVEPNYDGHGSNNNYFVFQRVSRKEEHSFKQKAFAKIDEYFSDQPHDPNKWGVGDVATYKD